MRETSAKKDGSFSDNAITLLGKFALEITEFSLRLPSFYTS